MAVPDPTDFFDQADKLIAPATGRTPTQVDLRRAVSAAYYGLFHAICAAAADQYVGPAKSSTDLYARVYRSVEHTRLKNPPSACNFCPDIHWFAAAIGQLQQKRLTADYDPLTNATYSDARLAVDQARVALQRFKSADADQREAFLGSLLFKARK